MFPIADAVKLVSSQEISANMEVVPAANWESLPTTPVLSRPVRQTASEAIAAYHQNLKATCPELGVPYMSFRQGCINAALEACKTMCEGLLKVIKPISEISEHTRKDNETFKKHVLLLLEEHGSRSEKHGSRFEKHGSPMVCHCFWKSPGGTWAAGRAPW